MAAKGECKLWPGAVDRDGYGRVKVGGRMLRAHRVSMEKRLGRELSRSEIVMHLCHHRACVNPAHLAVGTPLENRRASVARQITLAKSVLGISG